MKMTENTMKIVGRRKEHPITFSASGDLLLAGARFNDEIHKMPSGHITCIPKGVTRFKNHEEANNHWLTCVANAIAKITRERT
jgi:hypothetical protein